MGGVGELSLHVTRHTMQRVMVGRHVAILQAVGSKRYAGTPCQGEIEGTFHPKARELHQGVRQMKCNELLSLISSMACVAVCHRSRTRC